MRCLITEKDSVAQIHSMTKRQNSDYVRFKQTLYMSIEEAFPYFSSGGPSGIPWFYAVS